MRLAFLLVAAALVAPLGAQAPRETAEQFAGRVQARLDTIKDFEADFVQQYQGGLLRTKTTEQGTVAIKRPGRMRWTYTKPERKEFIADGTRIYSYLPRDKQVIVSPMPADDQTTPALFLAGRGHLVRDFGVEFVDVPGAPAGTVGLKLTPRKPDPEFEWLMLSINPGRLQIQQLVALDRQGGQSSFTFTNLEENRNLSDKLFEFQIPRGVDVITNGVRGQH